jgi:hypothetical protein
VSLREIVFVEQQRAASDLADDQVLPAVVAEIAGDNAAPVAVVVGAAVSARSRIPDLKPWHRLVPSAEVHAADVGPAFTLDEYLAREQRVFDEVRTRIEDPLAPEERLSANRYDRGGRASPLRLGRDWNRTFEMATAAPAPCAVLLIHGLTDSPYSMRAIAERLHAEGNTIILVTHEDELAQHAARIVRRMFNRFRSPGETISV